MLVPVFRALGSGVVVAQTRGTNFATTCAVAEGKYEVDTIDSNGSVSTTAYQLEGTDANGSDVQSTLRFELIRLSSVGLSVLFFLALTTSSSWVVRRSGRARGVSRAPVKAV